MKVYFQNSKSEEREIGQADTFKEAWYIINAFLLDHEFSSYYTRVWKENDTGSRYIIDVGSHTEFFIIDTNGIDLYGLMECEL